MNLHAGNRSRCRVAAVSVAMTLGIAVAISTLQPFSAQEKSVTDARAQFELGVRYEEGQGVPRNYWSAAAWYARAAEQGHHEARHRLVGLYQSNQGVPINTVEALKWLGLEEAGAVGDRKAALATLLATVARSMTAGEIVLAKQLASEWARRMAERDPSVRSLDLSTLSALQGGVARRGVSDVYNPGIDGVSLPRLLHEAKPTYTKDAMGARIQGHVLLDCIVGIDGKVRDCEVLRSLDAKHGLDGQAIQAAYQWRFEPAEKDGRPVAVVVTLDISFNLTW
jgi:TonB family protein